MKHSTSLQGTVFSLVLVLAGCSGGGGGQAGVGNGGGGGGGTLRPWAIEEAGLTGTSQDLLIPGDMFIGEMDAAVGAQIGDQMWMIMRAPTIWTGTNPLYTYQFFDDTDPFTNWGRAYRHTGFDTYAGPVIGPPGFYGTGTYHAATGQQYDAAILRTWDADRWELIIIQGNQSFVHAIQHLNGYPIADTYTAQ